MRALALPLLLAILVALVPRTAPRPDTPAASQVTCFGYTLRLELSPTPAVASPSPDGEPVLGIQ